MGSRRRCGGFTLVELLVVAAGGSLLILAVATVLVQQLRLQHQLEGRNRLQERWARISFLLEQEIQEAHTVIPLSGSESGLQLTICEPLATASFYAPTPSSRCSDGPNGAADTPGTDVTIENRFNAGTRVLSRVGPDVDDQERLIIPGATLTSELSSGVSAFSATVQTGGSSVSYTLSLVDPNDPEGGASFSDRGSVARARIQRL